MSEHEFFDQICVALAGRAAELEFYDEITTGASDDLNKTFQMARSMVSKYGMFKDIGYVSFQEGSYQKTYGSKTNTDIDQAT